MLKKYIALGVIGCVALLSFGNANARYDRYGYDTPYETRYNNPRFKHYDNGGYYQHKVRYNKSRYSDEGYERAERSGSAPFPSSISGGNVIKVDLGKLAWGAYDGSGNLVKWGRASGGKSYCKDIGRSCRTVTGTYTIYSKKGPGCKSSRFPVGKGGAPMPYCMHFKGGYAMHGGQVPNYNASHGCVRLPVADAQWLNQNFVRVGSTRVSIKY